MKTFFKAIQLLSSKKYECLKYLIVHAEEGGLVFKTINEINQESGLSITVIDATLKILKDNGLILRKHGVIKLLFTVPQEIKKIL